MAEEKQEAATPAVSNGEAAGGDGYRVSLPEFEGPLDLLLHLIQKHELDILNIPIGFISEKYVEYIRMMEELSIDLAAEYLVMAATLAHIKSRMLLPPDPTQSDEDELLEEEQDPRAELIRRLLEYQKYKFAAEELGQRSVLGRDVFSRGIPVETSSGPAPLAQLSLFKLVDAFEEVLKRAKQVEEHQIDFERISISEKIAEISDRLQIDRVLRFEQLFENDSTKSEMIVTFLALLEMTKLRLTNLRQDGPLEPILVELAVLDADDEAEPGLVASGEEAETEDDVLSRWSPPSSNDEAEPDLDDEETSEKSSEVELDETDDDEETSEWSSGEELDEMDANEVSRESTERAPHAPSDEDERRAELPEAERYESDDEEYVVRGAGEVDAGDTSAASESEKYEAWNGDDELDLEETASELREDSFEPEEPAEQEPGDEANRD